MTTLNYQNSDDGKVERTGVLRQWFGPSQKEVWLKLAEALPGKYETRGWLKGSRVTAEVGPWQVTLDTVQRDKVVFTRLRAPFVNPEGFRFRVYRKSIFTNLGKVMGMQDIDIGGDPMFDNDFVVKSNDEIRARQLLSSPRLRMLIDAQPKIHFSVRDDEGWFGATFPEGVDELYFECCGVVKDHELLKGLFDLFAETLQRLCVMGSAYETPAGVKL